MTTNLVTVTITISIITLLLSYQTLLLNITYKTLTKYQLDNNILTKICSYPSVFLHELSHALSAKITGQKIYEFNVQYNQGHVTHTVPNSQWWRLPILTIISLSPYFIPTIPLALKNNITTSKLTTSSQPQELFIEISQLNITQIIPLELLPIIIPWSLFSCLAASPSIGNWAQPGDFFNIIKEAYNHPITAALMSATPFLLSHKFPTALTTLLIITISSAIICTVGILLLAILQICYKTIKTKNQSF